jgi:hypothetical protein
LKVNRQFFDANAKATIETYLKEEFRRNKNEKSWRTLSKQVRVAENLWDLFNDESKAKEILKIGYLTKGVILKRE